MLKIKCKIYLRRFLILLLIFLGLHIFTSTSLSCSQMHFGRAINMRALFRSVVCLQAQACPRAYVKRKYGGIRFCIHDTLESHVQPSERLRVRNFPELIRSRFTVGNKLSVCIAKYTDLTSTFRSVELKKYRGNVSR